MAAGEGIEEIFNSLGRRRNRLRRTDDESVHRGYRLRCQPTHAETVFILPNNSNIILAAEQAKAVAEERIVVIPSKTIPQGMAAMLAFREDADPDRNAEGMSGRWPV